ncbi:hypothetical protein F4859DRAFT_379167 [Xylaria cf. heliscus]|nr:hypothetical protein F4859DRAFT_379167 [Xylaria cf. heliscus]
MASTCMMKFLTLEMGSKDGARQLDGRVDATLLTYILGSWDPGNRLGTFLPMPQHHPRPNMCRRCDQGNLQLVSPNGTARGTVEGFQAFPHAMQQSKPTVPSAACCVCYVCYVCYCAVCCMLCAVLPTRCLISPSTLYLLTYLLTYITARWLLQWTQEHVMSCQGLPAYIRTYIHTYIRVV